MKATSESALIKDTLQDQRARKLRKVAKEHENRGKERKNKWCQCERTRKQSKRAGEQRKKRKEQGQMKKNVKKRAKIKGERRDAKQRKSSVRYEERIALKKS